MTTIEHTTSQLKRIAASNLEKSPLNARRTVRQDGIGELKASILAHGLMQNLVATDAGNGTYRVIAGGRRLEAIRSLQSEGKLPEDFEVPCQIVTETHALEMSLAENTVRLAMHPADQFEAFAALIEQGDNAAQVAERFGIEENLVLKRMKLARVAPSLLEEYRKDGLTLECLMAFTITDDHRRQMKVFKSLQDWQKDDPSAIRACLTEKLVEASDKLARFVGMDAYLAAGGTSRADLFGDEVYLEKPALLHRLAEKKLDAIRKELEAEGWGWVQIHPDCNWEFVNRCSRIQPKLIDAPADLLDLKTKLDSELEQVELALEDTESDALIEQQQALRDRLDEVEEKLAAFVGFDQEQKSLAGCFISIGQDGTPFLDKGLVKPEHKKQLASLLKAESGDEAVPVARNGGMSESLRPTLRVTACRLPRSRWQSTRPLPSTIASFMWQAASSAMLLRWTARTCNSSGILPTGRARRKRRWPVLPLTRSRHPCRCRGSSLHQKPHASRRFSALPDASKQELFAFCVALTLQPTLGSDEGDGITAFDAVLSARERMWRVTGVPARTTIWGVCAANSYSRLAARCWGIRGRSCEPVTRKPSSPSNWIGRLPTRPKLAGLRSR